MHELRVHHPMERKPMPSCTPALVSITAPSRTTKQRSPMDVVLVLHIQMRCKSPANWHDLLNQAADLIVNRLREDDCLAIVPALEKETKMILGDAKIVPAEPKLLPMNCDNKIAASNSVKFSEAMRRSNTPLMKDLESAESILYGRKPDDKETRPGYIIVISNSNDDMSPVLNWRFPSVHAFGFCDAHNARTMYSIASSRESTYGILDDGDSISPAFSESINKITSAAEPMTIELKCKQEVVLSSILGPRVSYFISYDNKFGIIWANAHPGTVRNFIVYLDIPSDYYYSDDLLNVEVKYGHHTNSIKLKEPPLVLRGFNKEVLLMEAAKIIAHIAAEDKNDRKQLDEAAEELRKRWSEVVRHSPYSREADEAGLLSGLHALIQGIETRLRMNNLWLECMLSWLSRQCWPLPPLSVDDKASLRDILGKSHHRIIDERESNETTEIATNDHLRLRVLAKVDDVPAALVQKPELGLPLLVRVSMLPVKEFEEQKRVPLDLVALLDVGCAGSEIPEKKLMLLNKAMGFVMERLSHNDRLAIIPVQSTVAIPVFGLLRMTVKRRREYAKMLSTSHGRKHLKRTTFLPTASVDNSSRKAGSSRTKLSKSLNGARKLLDDRHADDKDRMGLIMVFSNSDDISISQRVLSTKYNIHAFSLCGANNAIAMYCMANSSSGIFAVVNDLHDELTEAFKACIRKITSTIAVNTKIHIMCKRSSTLKLSTIESAQFKSTIDNRKKTGTIFAGALYPGAERTFVAYLKNIRNDEYEDLSRMLEINVTWQHGSNRVDERLDGHVVIVSDEASKDVVNEIVRIQVSKIVSAITDPKTETERVLDMVQKLRSSDTVPDDNEIVDNLVSSVIHSPSLSNMLSWLSFQGLCEKLPSATS